VGTFVPCSADGGLIEVAGLPYWESRVKPRLVYCQLIYAHGEPLVDETSERHLNY